jgi:hypothetical protein
MNLLHFQFFQSHFDGIEILQLLRAIIDEFVTNSKGQILHLYQKC